MKTNTLLLLLVLSLAAMGATYSPGTSRYETVPLVWVDSSGGTIGAWSFIRGYQMDTAVSTDRVSYLFTLPREFVAGSSIVIRGAFVAFGVAGSGTSVKMQYQLSCYTDSEADTFESTATATTVVSAGYAQGDIVREADLVVYPSSGAQSSGDICGLTATRLGADAADTYAGDIAWLQPEILARVKK